MKCKNCGGEIRLEDMYCPYCGSPNLEAQRHARDMQQYRERFERTQEDVAERAGRQSRRAIRIAAAALLLVAIGINIFIQANSFAITGLLMESRQKKNRDSFRQRLEACLDEEDYLAFSALYSGRRMYMRDDELFDRYYPLSRVSSSYRYAVQYIMKLLSHSRYAGMDHITKYVSEYVQDFYENLDPDNYTFYEDRQDPDTQLHFDKMASSMDELLVAYLGFTQEEAQSMRTISRGRRVLLIERGLEAYAEEGKNE